jgi:hypothetical protein
MARKRKSTEASLPLALFGDVLSYIVTAGPALSAFTASVYVLRRVWDSSLFYVLLPLMPVLFLGLFLAVVFVLRLVLPRLRPGVYPATLNLGMMAWLLHLGLSRAGLVFGLREVILAFNLTKFLYWRALGGNVHFQVAASLTTSLVDLPLLTIRRGVTLADGALICCHDFEGDQLTLAPVLLEENVFIGKDCTLWPNTKIGASSWVGMNSIIGPNVTLGSEVTVGLGNILSGIDVPDGTKIDRFQYEHGNRRPRSDDNA